MTDPDQLPENIRQIVESNVLVPDVKVRKLAAIIATERARADALQTELDLRRKSGSAADRLHNLIEGIAADADGSAFSREEWDRIDAENAALRKRADALEAALRRWLPVTRPYLFDPSSQDQWAADRALLEKKT